MAPSLHPAQAHRHPGGNRGNPEPHKGNKRRSLWFELAMKRAVEHALLIIAEAAKNIPDDLKQKRPEVPWKRIHGLGNMLRHEYRRIDSDILWSVVTENLDGLDKAIEALLADLPK
jgi:uncharacterized protein with HEPN domain